MQYVHSDDAPAAIGPYASELAQKESDLLQLGLDYPVWSPYDAFEAADTMLQFIETAK